MGKHLDAVKPLDQFRAPWETEAGEDADIDKPKLKRFIFNLITDKAKAQDARDEAQETLTKAESDLEEAKAEAADANGDEAQKKINKLQKKVDDLTAERDKLTADAEEAELRTEVLEGLDSKYAKYVKGKTREELEKSREQVEEDFGLTPNQGDDEEKGEDEPTVRTTPRTRIKNPTDPKAGQGSDTIDFDKVADEIVGAGIFG